MFLHLSRGHAFAVGADQHKRRCVERGIRADHPGQRESVGAWHVVVEQHEIVRFFRGGAAQFAQGGLRGVDGLVPSLPAVKCVMEELPVGWVVVDYQDMSAFE